MPLYQHRFGGVSAIGEQWLFSWWSDSASDIDTIHTAAETWLTTFWTDATNGYQQFCTADVIAQSVRTGEITEATGQQQALREGVVSLPGIGVGPAQPADVSIVVSLRTALANRSGRGRFYLPQPHTGLLTNDGKLGASAAQAVVDVATTAWTAYVASGTPVVYSRVLRTTQPITSYNVGDLLDTQRRRENRTAENRTSANMP